MYILNTYKRKLLEEIKELLKECNVEIRSIIAPPRTGSTMLEASFALNEAVTNNGNEIFKFMDLDPENGFERSTQLLKHEIRQAQVPGSKGILVIKDMSIWIEGAMDFIHELTDYPILFLIRNPELSMESRIKKYLEKIPHSNQSHIHNWIKKYYHISEKDELPTSIQLELFNKYARSFKHENWEALLLYMQKNADYSAAYEIIEALFPEKQSGFDKLKQQIELLQEKKVPYMLVDSSELRLHPNRIQKLICEKWDLIYDPVMTNWGNRIKDFKIGDRVIFSEIWFGRLLRSNGIEPPSEIPIVDFPNKIKTQTTKDLEIYKKLAQNPNKISARITADILVELDKEIALTRKLITPETYAVLGKETTVSLPFRLIDPEAYKSMAKYKSTLEGIGKNKETLH